MSRTPTTRNGDDNTQYHERMGDENRQHSLEQRIESFRNKFAGYQKCVLFLCIVEYYQYLIKWCLRPSSQYQCSTISLLKRVTCISQVFPLLKSLCFQVCQYKSKGANHSSTTKKGKQSRITPYRFPKITLQCIFLFKVAQFEK